MFKKLSLALLLCLLLAGQAWAAYATITKTEYGYEITGGTDKTAIETSVPNIWIKSIVFQPATAGDVATFYSAKVSGGSDIQCLTMTSVDLSPLNKSWSGDGCMFSNMKVTLTSASDIVYIYLGRLD